MLLAISCSTKTEEKGLNIGIPVQKIQLDLSGDQLVSYIHTKLLSDTSRNLIAQLGSYTFSTSVDPVNSYDNRYNPDVILYYEYPGLTLKYTGKGAGMTQRKELQSVLESYPNSFYLDEIILEPKLYKNTLPFKLTKNSGPYEVEQLLGKHNSFFDSGSTTVKLSYTYPEHGLFVRFNYYPGSLMPDSSILVISLKDPLTEMKRYPTLFPGTK
jgi:hypothetical protein